MRTNHGRRRNSLVVIYASLFLHCQISCRIRFSTSFQVPSSPVYTASSRYLTKNEYADGDGDAAASSNEDDSGNSIFNKNAILGENVNRRDGTYSWSNPKAFPKDDNDTRSPNRLPNNVAADSKEHYKQIPFDGCGSILLHEQPESFIAPSNKNDNETSARQRQEGRTGVSLWSASYVISYYIDAQWSNSGSWYHGERATDSDSRWTVLELGAGLGLCSCVAAKHGMNVVSTDNDPPVLSLLRENLQRNKFHDDDTLDSTQSISQQSHVHSLDWLAIANDPNAESSHPVFLQLESLGGADLILLSDVIYGATQPAWDALLILLNKFCAQRRRIRLGQVNGDEDDTTTNTKMDQSDRTLAPRVLLGYTHRRRDMSPQDEARFFAMVKAAGMEAILIPSTRIPNGDKYIMTSLFELQWVD